MVGTRHYVYALTVRCLMMKLAETVEVWMEIGKGLSLSRVGAGLEQRWCQLPFNSPLGQPSNGKRSYLAEHKVRSVISARLPTLVPELLGFNFDRRVHSRAAAEGAATHAGSFLFRRRYYFSTYRTSTSYQLYQYTCRHRNVSS